MLHIFDDKTILEFVIWLTHVAKKHQFILFYYRKEKEIIFDLLQEIDEIMKAESCYFYFSKKEFLKNDSFMDVGRVIVEKVENRIFIRFQPAGLQGLKELEPILEDFGKEWANLKYDKKEKLVIDDIEKFKLELVNEFRKQNSLIVNNSINTGKHGRKKSNDDLDAWERVIIKKEPKNEVYKYWKNLEGVKQRKLLEDSLKRQFQRITKPDYGLNK